MIIAAPGSRSDGLTIKVFPVAVAMGIVHSGIMLYACKSNAQWRHNNALRREVERRHAGTYAERHLPDVGVHVLANYSYVSGDNRDEET